MNRTLTTAASTKFAEEVADALREYEERLNVSDPELADRAGIDRKTLIRIRKGLLPKTDLLIAILNELGLKLAIVEKDERLSSKLTDKKIDAIVDLLETEWGYEGMREDVLKILRGEGHVQE